MRLVLTTMVSIEYTLMVQRAVTEWLRLLLPETLLKQFGYQIKIFRAVLCIITHTWQKRH